MRYHEFGPFGTRRGGAWFVLVMTTLSLAIVLAQGDGPLSVVFVLATAAAAGRILHRLAKLEPEAQGPTACMKLAFDAAMSFPCLGAAAIVLP